MEKLKQSVEVIINGTKCIVKIPNVGQSFKIEELKMDLTGGTYSEMSKSGLISHNYNLDLVDAISTFSVMIPKLKEILDITSFENMEMLTGKELVKAYRKYYAPFYKEFTASLYSDLDEQDEQKES